MTHYVMTLFNSLFNDTHLVAKDPLKFNNAINTCLTSLNIILCYS